MGRKIARPDAQGWPKDDDDLLRRLGELRHLEVLFFEWNKDITDAKLARFSGLGQLRTLSFSHSGVTGAGLVHLKDMSRLKDLRIDGLPIRDGDLAKLSGLTRLKELRSSGRRPHRRRPGPPGIADEPGMACHRGGGSPVGDHVEGPRPPGEPPQVNTSGDPRVEGREPGADPATDPTQEDLHPGLRPRRRGPRAPGRLPRLGSSGSGS